MKDIYHDTEYVSKLIHYAGKRIYGLLPLRWWVLKLSRQCRFLDDKEKDWFMERLYHATVDVKDIDDAKTYADANLAINGKIEVVGGSVDVSGKIAWHTDFKNNYTWEKGVKFTKYQIIGEQGGRDVKTVWDLSRCHHLLWLAAAYRQTGDNKYSQRIVETIDDWISDNPFGRSVNWVCPMDVAIRAVNWIFAVQMIVSSEKVSVVFLRRLFKSLYQHASFIYDNLEKSDPFSENHYASDVTGLLFLGYLFDCENKGNVWLDYSLKSLLYEIRTQILPSGAHFERSVSYHRLVTELFLYSYLIIQKNTPQYISVDITYRLQAMIGFVASYSKPSGYAPLLADNDNGRLLPFVKRDYREHIYLLELAKAYGIVLGPSVKELFSDAGFAFVREGQYYLSFTNTPTSRYSRPWRKGSIGTHTHLDALSVEISKGKQDFIVDAGAFTYTESEEIRREFRSMKKHNTMTVDNDDPYLLSDFFGITAKDGGVFDEPETIQMVDRGSDKFLCSSFLWKAKKVKQKREIAIDSEGIVITDSICTDEMHDFDFRFHLNAGVETEEVTPKSLLLNLGNNTMRFSVESNEDYHIDVVKDTVSPAYGVILDAWTIVVHMRANNNFTMTTRFQ